MPFDEEKSKLVQETDEINQNEAKPPRPKFIGSEDQRQMNSFLGPMMKELEESIAEHMKYLDFMEEDLLGDNKRETYNLLVAHIPEEIRGRKSMQTILKNLESLINESEDQGKQGVQSDSVEKTVQDYINEKESSQKEKQNELVKLEDLNNLACMSNSLSAYLFTKNCKKNLSKLKTLTIKIYDSVNLWLSRLFRFNNSSVLFYEDDSDGLIRVLNMVLNYKYPEFQIKGFESIHKKPVLYVSAASKYAKEDLRKVITTQLGLPLTSIKIVEVSKNIDHTLDKIDVGKFQEIVEKDINEGLIPVALIANAGSSRIGQYDDLTELNTICYQYRIWVHLEGVYLSTLALYSVPTVVQPVWSGDSVTLDLATWLGIPSLSYVTLYRNVEKSALFIQPFNNFKNILQRALPYWTVLQAMGHEGVIERIKYANEISVRIKEIVEAQKPYIQTLSFRDPNRKNEIKINSLSDLFVKALSFLTYVELNNPIILFKIDPKFVNERLLFMFSDIPVDTKPTKKLSPFQQHFMNSYSDIFNEEKEIKGEKKEKIFYSEEIVEYTDTLTSWLYELINLNSNIEFELLEIENEGLCIKYSSLEHVNIYGTSHADIEEFSSSFNKLMSILDASIRCKTKFEKEIKEYKNLMPVKVPKWAGVGAVRYIPDYLIDRLAEIKDFFIKKSELDSVEVDSNIEKYAKEINELNEQIVKKLQSQDNAFSAGEATDKYSAIQFGMVNDIDSLKRLFNEVQNVSKEVEESSRFIETMSDLIRQGIQKANEDLKKENEQKLVQEGLLRQIPFVGGLFSWISPTPSVNTIGRTFNLQSGKILSTETTYKYHVQVEEASDNDLNLSNQDQIKRDLSMETVKLNFSTETSDVDSVDQSRSETDTEKIVQNEKN